MRHLFKWLFVLYLVYRLTKSRFSKHPCQFTLFSSSRSFRLIHILNKMSKRNELFNSKGLSAIFKSLLQWFFIHIVVILLSFDVFNFYCRIDRTHLDAIFYFQILTYMLVTLITRIRFSRRLQKYLRSHLGLLQVLHWLQLL